MAQNKFPQVAVENRPAMMTGGYLLFCLLYLGAPLLAWQTPHAVPILWLDDMIPFLPWSVWAYLSQFGLLFCAIWHAPDNATRTQAFYAMLLASAIAAAVFIIFPTELPRMAVEGPAWRLLYTFDVPGNCFPSLHAALAAIAAAALVRAGGLWAAVAPLWAAMIIFSALATKQHVVLDIAGGLVLALACQILVRHLKVSSHDHA
ncbi:MAG: inositol phosphorylceramide synthase [Alphaproteobacteria bacterium]|nr:MAG: inositol phosphorylceramide synthase [Alphaproteobacteria bacterium]